MADNKTLPRYTLADFVEDNHKLLTVFGVFVAVTAFANNLPSKLAGRSLSYFALLAAISLGIELFRKFLRGLERGAPTMTLFLFYSALIACIVWVFSYWLLGYPDMWEMMIMVVPPVAFVVSVGSVVSTRYPHLFKDRVFLIWFSLVNAALAFLAVALAPSIAQWLRQTLPSP